MESRQAQEVERNFRRRLEEIASQISPDHLSVLLFTCKEILPDATSEQITRPYDLFLELERRGKLSSNNISLLCQLLGKIGLNKLSQDLEEFGSPITTQVLEKVSSNYKLRIKKIVFSSPEISRNTVSIKYVFKTKKKWNIINMMC